MSAIHIYIYIPRTLRVGTQTPRRAANPDTRRTLGRESGTGGRERGGQQLILRFTDRIIFSAPSLTLTPQRTTTAVKIKIDKTNCESIYTYFFFFTIFAF